MLWQGINGFRNTEQWCGVESGCCCFLKNKFGSGGATATLVTFRRATDGAALVTGGGPGGSNCNGGREGARRFGSSRLRVMISWV